MARFRIFRKHHAGCSNSVELPASPHARNSPPCATMSCAVVKLLFCATIFLAIFEGIRSPPSPPRWTRGRSSGTPGPAELWRRLRGSISPNRNGGASSSSNRWAQLRGSSPQPSRQPPPQNPFPLPPNMPFPYITNRVGAATQEDLNIFNTFVRMHQNPGDSDMTLDDFKRQKSVLLLAVNNDICNVDTTNGGANCVQALKAFQSIPRAWRGPCKEAFMAMCLKWTPPVLGVGKCSFFMKTAPVGYNPPIFGYSHTMQDCVGALRPANYERHLNTLVDSWLNIPENGITPGRV